MKWPVSNTSSSLDDALGNVTRTQYDIDGRVVATQDALGRIVKFQYDAFGRPLKTIFPPDGYGQGETFTQKIDNRTTGDADHKTNSF